ncbi:UNVERIFIED_CONTAM: hypothetical protein FKN15_075036 [Acipenser sinensis]
MVIMKNNILPPLLDQALPQFQFLLLPLNSGLDFHLCFTPITSCSQVVSERDFTMDPAALNTMMEAQARRHEETLAAVMERMNAMFL